MENSISVKLKIWRQANPQAQGEFVTYELQDIPTDTSFLETRSPSCSTTTAARVFAVCAHYTSTAILMDPLPELPLASSTCAASRMVRLSQLSLGVQQHSPLLRT